MHLESPLLTSLLALAPLVGTGDLAPLVVRDVRLAPEADAPRHSILVRDGRIEAIVDASVALPAGYRALDGGGRLALPAFVDAFTQTGLVAPAPVADQDRPVDPTTGPQIEMREADRKGVRVAFRAADTLALDEKAREAWREGGFGALCVAPAGELLGGTSALASPRELARRDAILNADALWHAAFAASGSGYPGTLIGYHAQFRQLFLDAAWQAELVARQAAGRPGPRPAHDKDLEAARELVAGTTRLACEAERSEDVERWLALAAEIGPRVAAVGGLEAWEIGVPIAVVGGRDAWEIAPRLAAEDVPVILTLDWGDEVLDPDASDEKEGADEQAEEDRWRYREPLIVRRERRRLWEEGRDSGQRLVEAGVRIAFGTAGAKPADLLKRVRELVAAGLARESALFALTQGAAEVCGVGVRLGAIEPGRDASFALWTADPLTARQAKVAWIVLEGEVYEGRVLREEGELPPDEGVDASGTWELELTVETAPATTLRLTMERDGRVHGTLEYLEPGAREARKGELEGRLRGSKLELSGRIAVGLYESDVKLEANVHGDGLEGTLEWHWSEGGDATSFHGRRAPEGQDETSEEPR